MLLLKHTAYGWKLKVPHLPATYILTTNVALFIKTSVLFAPLGV
jgi:hypothetical protein